VLDFLYHDDALVALAKPAGRIVVPGRGAAATERTLREDVAQALGRDVFVVHRLDRGTSGVLLFAVTAEAHRALSMAFERHQIDKRYWGFCRGTLLGSGEVNRALVPIRGGKVRPARPGDTGGKPSVTAWRAIERFGGQGAGQRVPEFTSVELRPRSGRLHQVRAHLAVLGHPLAVDPDYGGAERLLAGDLNPSLDSGAAEELVLDRVPLHAERVRFRHPTNGKPVEIAAPLPPDLERVVALLRSPLPSAGEG
jgi:tRNA pseudouridine32 synthase / 23S rRNA pseudouridine746 synthase